MATTINRLQVFSKAECEEIVHVLSAHAPYFIPRHQGLFYTFGTATYLDGENRPLSKEYNSYLESYFLTYYIKLTEKLCSVFGDCFYSERWGWPGFHIFINSPEANKLQANVHRDLQWQKLMVTPPDETMTFTIALEIPKSGAGLNIFHENVIEMVPYNLGEMTYFIGDSLVHQIRGFSGEPNYEKRITMQGHGIKRGGVWEIYW